jgi:hypothetical protein
MAPARRAAIPRATAWVMRSVPVTVTSTCGAQSAGPDSRKGFRWVAAALLTSTSIGPSSRSTRATAAPTAPSSRRSAPTAAAFTPSARASTAAASAPAEDAWW